MKRLIEIALKIDKVRALSDLTQQKFTVAASQGDQQAMDTARNEYHAVVDRVLDLVYENARIRSEMEQKMLKDLDND